MKTQNYITKKVYEVTLYLDEKEVMRKEVDMYHYIIQKRVKAWCDVKIKSGHKAGYSINEVKKWSVSKQPDSKVQEKKVNLNALFLEERTQKDLDSVNSEFKGKISFYKKQREFLKLVRLEYKYIEFLNSVKDEFVHSCNVSDNTLWKWQDFLKSYDKTGYLVSRCYIERYYDEMNESENAAEKSRWKMQIKKSWERAKKEDFCSAWCRYLCYLSSTDQNKAYEILKLVKDFNLDSQDSELVEMFKNDFMSSNDVSFGSVILKWTDLIFWSSWKLELYKSKVCLSVNSHWESDKNPDFDSFDQEEV